MGKSDPPPPPDYTAVAAASERAAELSYDMAKEQLAWAKEQDAMNRVVSNRVIDEALSVSALNRDTAEKDRARYEQLYQPLEDKLAADADSYSSPDRQEYEAGRAQGAVSQQFEAARNSAKRQLEGYGINPASTRFAALDMGSRTQQAASEAAAGNQAREAAGVTGRALRSEAINVGRGYPGQIAGQYATGLQAGNQAAGTGNTTTQTSGAVAGTPAQFMGAGNTAIGNWGNTLNMGYQNQLGAYKAEQASSSGVGSLLGLGLSMFGFEEGGLVPEGSAIPEPGGMVPAEASPSGGRATDDVNAIVNEGEFIVPDDVTRWKGEEFFQKLIAQSRQNKQGAGAKPQMKQALPGPVTHQSPGAGG